ncbi:MAG TPA: hypothetical protein VMW29_04000 [Candidatus Bathyarchaeia archaeon]|nr:hypothetical protein [Candidatus Bathyarchaeia archaeon]
MTIPKDSKPGKQPMGATRFIRPSRLTPRQWEKLDLNEREGLPDDDLDDLDLIRPVDDTDMLCPHEVRVSTDTTIYII